MTAKATGRPAINTLRERVTLALFARAGRSSVWLNAQINRPDLEPWSERWLLEAARVLQLQVKPDKEPRPPRKAAEAVEEGRDRSLGWVSVAELRAAFPHMAEDAA